MQNKAEIEEFNQLTGGNFFATPDASKLPEDREELDLYMQLNYKQSVEIAEEEVIK